MYRKKEEKKVWKCQHSTKRTKSLQVRFYTPVITLLINKLHHITSKLSSTSSKYPNPWRECCFCQMHLESDLWNIIVKTQKTVLRIKTYVYICFIICIRKKNKMPKFYAGFQWYFLQVQEMLVMSMSVLISNRNENLLSQITRFFKKKNFS